MAIPLAYNLRNLAVRRTTTVMTALGIGLTVAVLIAVVALMNGLRSTFEATGHPLHVLVVRKGSGSEGNSQVARSVFQDIKFKPGIAKTASGEPMASLEVITGINLPSVENPDGMNLTVRGFSPMGIALRETGTLVAGRWFQEGRREAVVGISVHRRYPAAKLGSKIRFGRGEWEVVGVVDYGRSAASSEVFCDLNQLAGDYNRTEVLSSVLLRAADPVALQALINDINDDRRLNMEAQTEKQYYEAQTSSGAPIQFMGTFVALIMAIGSAFAAMNTMYAAVARRAREIGTLRVLGFSRGSILFSFFIESLLLAAMGGLVGCLLVLPLHGIETGILNFSTFAETAFQFRITPQGALTGMIFAMFIGVLGGMLPARMAARKEILNALRDI
jgi:putative ABC transport system permease protein